MKYFKIFALMLTFFAVVSCSKKEEDLWIVGTSADNPPYEFLKDGEIQGFDIDLMIAIAKHLGKKIEFKNMEFHGLLAALASKNIDMSIAAMSVTPERLARVDFSIPYTDSKIAVLYRIDNNFTEPSDFKGYMIGAQLGTIWTLIAHDMSIKYSFRTKSLASNLMLVEELKNGRIDGVMLEESQVQKFVEKNNGLAGLAIPQYGSSFSIALPKGSEDKKNIDHTIKSLRSNGTIASLAKKWGLVGAE